MSAIHATVSDGAPVFMNARALSARNLGMSCSHCLRRSAKMEVLTLVRVVSWVFEHEGQGGRNQGQAIDALAAMSGEITDDLRGAHGVSDQHHVMEVQLLEQRAEVVRERIVVIPASRIAAPTVAALVVGDAARMLGERDHLILPDVTIDRPSVHEDDRPTLTPAAPEQLHAVAGFDRVHRHFRRLQTCVRHVGTEGHRWVIRRVASGAKDAARAVKVLRSQGPCRCCDCRPFFWSPCRAVWPATRRRLQVPQLPRGLRAAPT